LLAAFWRRQFYSGPPRFGETNRYRLLRRSGAVFALPNVFHFLTHKFPSLSAGGLAFALVLARAFDCFFFWHNKMVSPLTTVLDVNKLRQALESIFGAPKAFYLRLFVCVLIRRLAAADSCPVTHQRVSVPQQRSFNGNLVAERSGARSGSGSPEAKVKYIQ
jgi:hypothetical protein